MAEIAWPLFEVAVKGFGSSIVAAPTRGKAFYSRYLDFIDAFPDTSFRDWTGLAKVTRLGRRPQADAYAWIRRNYGVHLAHGTRVTLQGEGPELNGRAGTVVHPGMSTSYAHVVMDGADHVIFVHPLSCIVVPAA